MTRKGPRHPVTPTLVSTPSPPGENSVITRIQTSPDGSVHDVIGGTIGEAGVQVVDGEAGLVHSDSLPF